MSHEIPAAGMRRNLSLDLLAALGVGVTVVVVSTLLPTVARRAGIEPAGLAALASAPFVANVLGAFSGGIGPRTPRQLALLRALGAGALVAVLIVPIPAVMVAAAFAFWVGIAFGTPVQLRLWGAMYPDRLRGRVLGVLGAGRAGAAVAATLLVGVAAAVTGDLPVIAAAGIVGMLAAAAYAGLRARLSDAPAFSARGSIRALTERPVLRRAVLAQALYGGGMIAAVPLYPLVYVDRLSLSLADVAVVATLISVATTVSFVAWGVVSDRIGPRAVLAGGSALGLGSLLGYTIAGDLHTLWVAAIAAGAASAGIDVGISAVISDNTPLESRGAAVAGWSAATGLRGMVAPFLGAGLVQTGFVDLTTALGLCAIATTGGVLLYLDNAGAPIRLGAHASLRESRAVRRARLVLGAATGR